MRLYLDRSSVRLTRCITSSVYVATNFAPLIRTSVARESWTSCRQIGSNGVCHTLLIGLHGASVVSKYKHEQELVLRWPDGK
jgi:hypothetical protein